MAFLKFLFRVEGFRQVEKPQRYPNREERAVLAAEIANEAIRCCGTTLSGKCHVIDGDTIVIKNIHVRLFGIDAPELEHPWGQKSKWKMVELCKGKEVTAEVSGELSHNRVVATCRLPDGRDLSAELVRRGLALDWAAYSGGRYRHLEPDGVRRKLWRAAQRQSRPKAAVSSSA